MGLNSKAFERIAVRHGWPKVLHYDQASGRVECPGNPEMAAEVAAELEARGWPGLVYRPKERTVELVRPPKRLRLGDAVGAITAALGIPECAGCKKRRAWLNGEKT